MRFAGTIRQYSQCASPQSKSIAFHKGQPSFIFNIIPGKSHENIVMENAKDFAFKNGMSLSRLTEVLLHKVRYNFKTK